MIITSGYRCSAHQDELTRQGYETAKGLSTHEQGWAADIKVQGFTGRQLEKLAREAEFEAVGVAKGWLHVDIRKGYRRWGYVRK